MLSETTDDDRMANWAADQKTSKKKRLPRFPVAMFFLYAFLAISTGTKPSEWTRRWQDKRIDRKRGKNVNSKFKHKIQYTTAPNNISKISTNWSTCTTVIRAHIVVNDGVKQLKPTIIINDPDLNVDTVQHDVVRLEIARWKSVFLYSSYIECVCVRVWVCVWLYADTSEPACTLILFVFPGIYSVSDVWVIVNGN